MTTRSATGTYYIYLEWITMEVAHNVTQLNISLQSVSVTFYSCEFACAVINTQVAAH